MAVGVAHRVSPAQEQPSAPQERKCRGVDAAGQARGAVAVDKQVPRLVCEGDFAAGHRRRGDRRGHGQLPQHTAGRRENPRASSRHADRVRTGPECIHRRAASVDRHEGPERQCLPEPCRAVGRAGDDRAPGRVELHARHCLAVARERREQAAVRAVVDAREQIVGGGGDPISVRAEGGCVERSGRADEKEFALAGGNVPDVGGAVLARGQERAAVTGELLVQDVALVLQHVEEAARGGVPDPRCPVAAAAREQLPIRAEGERADPGLGQTPDHATRVGAEDLRAR